MKAQAKIVEDTCPEYMVEVVEVLLKIPFHPADWFPIT